MPTSYRRPGVQRRNVIRRRDAWAVQAIALAAGLLAAAAGCQPTGETVPDALLCAGFAWFVTWVAASAPWWALVVASGLAAATASNPLLLASSVMAVVAAGAIGTFKLSAAPLRAAVAGVALQSLLRIEWDPFFLAPSLITATAAGILVFSGLPRRSRAVRTLVVRSAYMAAGLVGVALVGAIVAGTQARSDAADGYDALVNGMGSLRTGDTPNAAFTLRQAADDLRRAADTLDTPWTQPARLVPVLAQHRSGLDDVLRRAGDAADAAAGTLALVDLDSLAMSNGVVDTAAIALLSGPVQELERALVELDAALGEADSPWLLAPFQSRVQNARLLADEVSAQVEITRAAVAAGPALLGDQGPRRYLVAFTSPAEARGQTGLMGNWAEITVDRGRLRLTADGRTSQLISGLEQAGEVRIDAPEEFFARYGRYGAGDATGTVRPKFWSNVTMSPHGPTVGSAMAQLYEISTGRQVDGVVIVDPAGIAALLQITGPIQLRDEGVTLTARNAEQFLLLDQYERPEAEREDILEAATKAMVDQLISGDLPGPQVLSEELRDAVAGGHLTFFATRPVEQELFEVVGADGGLPVLSGTDGLAVVNDNGSANKIDSFLDRQVRYAGVADERSGEVEAELTITLTNEAPVDGYPDYVIGNGLDLPSGTNRTILSVFTPLDLVAVTLDGQEVHMVTDTERGWQVHSTVVTVASGDTATVVLQLAGNVGPGDYRLVYRPQPLAQPERLAVEVSNRRDRVLAGFVGTLRQRSVLDSDGLSRWPER